MDYVGAGPGKKEVGIKADEEQLKILDDVPNSAVEMIVKEKVRDDATRAQLGSREHR